MCVRGFLGLGSREFVGLRVVRRYCSVLVGVVRVNYMGYMNQLCRARLIGDFGGQDFGIFEKRLQVLEYCYLVIR